MGRANKEQIRIDVDALRDLALYLSGVKEGKGNLLPLGTIVLDNLWNTISYLNGNDSFIVEKLK